ncbi:MAG: AAA domain-containing protein [Sphingobacteriales bacterium]|nr:AAA domain-containing protein [Sphingobacteriales bacterium]
MTFSKTLIDKNRQSWIARLIDTTRRNNLLFFAPEPTERVFPLNRLGSDALERLMRFESLSPNKLLKEDGEKKTLSSLKQIARRSKSNEEERSIKTLYLARGLFRWPAGDGGKDFCAPALLLALDLRKSDGAGREFKIQLEGEVELNRPLAVYWSRELGIDLSDIEPAIEALDPDAVNDGWKLAVENVLETLKGKGAAVAGMQFEDGGWISNFSFQKLGLVQDLEAFREHAYTHPLVAALCGDEQARAALQEVPPDFLPENIDSLPAEDDFTFLPCDSSQFTVIRNVIQGKSGVIQGPPGTGKSQVIANLIAELVARGKRVLFVAEKKAALDVVYDRLHKAGLSEMVLNLHSGDMRGRKLAEQLAQGLQVLRSPAVAPQDGTLGEWERIRHELVEHIDILHKPWKPWNLSAYACMEWLMDHPGIPASGLRIAATTLDQIGSDQKSAWMLLLDELARTEARMIQTGAVGWRMADKNPGEAVGDLLEKLEDLLAAIQKLREAYTKTPEGCGSVLPEDSDRLNTDIEWLKSFAALHPKLTSPAKHDWLEADIRLLQEKKNQTVGRWASSLFSSSYNAAVRRVNDLFREKDDLFDVLLPLAEQWLKVQSTWKGEIPSAPLDLSAFFSAYDSFSASRARLAEFIPWFSSEKNINNLTDGTKALLSSRDQAFLVPKLAGIRSEMNANGLDLFVQQCDQAGIVAEQRAAAFDLLFHHSVLSLMKSRDPRIAAVDGRRQDEKRSLFRELDIKRQSLAVTRIRRTHAERMTALLNRFPSQENAIRAQSQRKHPQPFKRIFRSAPDVLLGVFPCWMASPLTVTQFLGAGDAPFDVVFFDEASQVQPEDAISSILRGKQLVVSGDTRQLPPTSFFADGGGNGEDTDTTGGPNTAGYESLLHLMLGALPGLGPAGDGWFLQWHYRSRDESLIAFSNTHIYNGRMVTFPRPSTAQAVHFVHVRPEVQTDVGQESSSAEVLRVVELAKSLSREHPTKSLGIIALGVEHAQRLEEAIDTMLESASDSEREFFSESRKEPFFVKNLERVQGDERDMIILSIGYGQNRSGVLSHNFGPINQEGGERRLNVAITRSREQMWVVASFDPAELNPERTKGEGPGLLRKYLLYAQSGGRNLGLERPTHMMENAFERDIRQALEAKGMQITSQYGVSGYRIDLVVHHPERPGEFVMAVECDGAAYHSAPCARDRDRLRQEFLESMGWNFHRIWSTDWFTNREEEIERAVNSYRRFVEESKTRRESKPPVPAVDKTVRDNSASSNPVSSKKRGERPPIPQYDSISDYQDRELFLLAQWILSDGELRTDQVLFEDLFDELGYKRKGSTITARLNDIIQRMKNV